MSWFTIYLLLLVQEIPAKGHPPLYFSADSDAVWTFSAELFFLATCLAGSGSIAPAHASLFNVIRVPSLWGSKVKFPV